jgi:hypothetical protein
VVVEQAQPPGLLIVNGEFVGRWSSTNAVTFEVAPDTEGKVSLVNCSFWGPIDRCVWMRSPRGTFSASACHFVHWDIGGAGSPALQLDAGRAILQACTFEQDNLHVRIGPDVTSAILTANQAPGGLRVDNHAGQRVQMGLNSEDPVVWTPEARAHYRLEMGVPGDARYLRGWHSPERDTRPYRWTTAASRLLLPALPGQPCELTLDAHVPAAAAAPATGLYLAGQRLCGLTNGTTTVTLPPAQGDPIELELRANPWVPRQVVAGSQDERALGVQVFSITLRAPNAGRETFRANAGQWPDRPASPQP